ncbi:Trp-like family [Globisporangium polare]
MSIALLVGFHFMLTDPNLSWSSALWSPNSWEFVLYVQYLQQATSVSALTLLKTPYFLWEFTDTFSWTNFLVQGNDGSDDSSKPTAHRRLRTIVLDGLVGYSDRIEQDETKIMFNSVTGFVIALSIVLVAFAVVTAIGRWQQKAVEMRRVALRILGVAVLVWYFSLFPLSLTSSFEMSMEVQANLIETWPMLLSIVALLGVCSAGLAYGARVVLHKSERELRRLDTLAVWSVLYAHYTHSTRMFLMFDTSPQIVVGICIGVFGSSSTLLMLLLAIQLLYLLAVFTIKPFKRHFVQVATYVVGMIKVLNLALAFAFLQSSDMTPANRRRVANAYLWINALVIYAWLLRLLVVFCSCVAVWSVRGESALSPRAAPARAELQLDANGKNELEVRAECPTGVLAEDTGYRTSISPAEATPIRSTALATATNAQLWSREHWERVV